MRAFHVCILIFFSVICYLYIDIPLAQVLANTSPVTHQVAQWVTIWMTPMANVVFWSLITLFLYIARGRKELVQATFQICCTCGFVMFATGLLKLGFCRARPNLLFDEGLYGFYFQHFGYGFRSFPSSHTSIAFGLATLFCIFSQSNLYWPLWIAFAFSFSRIVLCHHYLSDIIAGAIIGHYVAKIVYYYTERYSRLLWNHFRSRYE